MPKSPAQPNQSLIDGLEVLKLLAVHEGGIGSREAARQLGLEPTRANRLLKTLGALGLARQGADAKYAAGPGMHVLAAQSLVGSGFVRRSIAPLESLRDLGLTVAMGVLWRRQVCYLYFAGPTTSPTDALGGRGLFAAERSAIGMPLLAALPDVDVRSLYADADAGALDAVLAGLRGVHEQGYAHLPADAGRDAAAVGVAVGAPPYAAIALAGAFNPANVPKLVQRLHAAATAIASP
jgi:DNA-binding IclR family transcriptional regulator